MGIKKRKRRILRGERPTLQRDFQKQEERKKKKKKETSSKVKDSRNFQGTFFSSLMILQEKESKKESKGNQKGEGKPRFRRRRREKYYRCVILSSKNHNN